MWRKYSHPGKDGYKALAETGGPMSGEGQQHNLRRHTAAGAEGGGGGAF